MPDTMLMSPPPGPLNPTQHVAAVIAAARPALNKDGDLGSLDALARAMVPLFGDFTVSDGAAMIATFRAAAAAVPECDAEGDARNYNANALFAVCNLLEDFCSHARGTKPEDHAARAWLLRQHAEGDEWDLGSSNLEAATKHLHHEAFHSFFAGETFASGVADGLGWLDRAVSAGGYVSDDEEEDDDA